MKTTQEKYKDMMIENGLWEPSPRSRRLAVYTASTLSHAPFWRELPALWPEVTFTARWPSQHCFPDGTPRWPESPTFGSIFWQQDFDDILVSDIVLCYGESGDRLRGALVEAGMAIGLGKIVITVGEHEGYGTWQFHKSVLRVSTLFEARKLLSLLAL